MLRVSVTSSSDSLNEVTGSEWLPITSIGTPPPSESPLKRSGGELVVERAFVG